jgi:hypothetical protein
MVLVKILKRRDASSVVVAILLAMIISQPLNQATSPLAGHLSGLKDGQYFGTAPPGAGTSYYVYLVVWAILQLVILELLGWLYVWAVSSSKKK